MSRHLFLYLCITSALARAALSQTLPTQAQAPAPAAEEPAPAAGAEGDGAEDESPEGYYAFVESPNATPPRVRAPPYRKSDAECPSARDARPHVSAHNLCGDLNRGDIPRNPMGHGGEPYPFELIRNHTLRFLSRALPALRNDESLPRVARLPTTPHYDQDHPAALAELHNGLEERSKRSAEPPSHLLRAEHRAGDERDELGPKEDELVPVARESRKFCDGGGVLCMLYRAINGDAEPALERREDPGPQRPATAGAPQPAPHRYEGPPTPCPARVEYATPVFARNYQGVWRYVVQIPYEGYFTQTVEVTRCMQSRCHYLEGGCLSSPRWVSLLVAELHYPAGAPAPAPAPQAQEYQQYLQKRVGGEEEDKPAHCDGHDNFGCYQVRLYYDWFLVPGSCKCWRPDYFARYVRRRHSGDL